MKNNIEALRAHLFDTLVALKDKDNPMDIERAKAISEVSQVIINTAKVEVQFAQATGSSTTAFLQGGEGEQLSPGITSVRIHKIQG